MRAKRIFKRLVSFLLVTILGISPAISSIGTLSVKAATDTAYEQNGVVYDGSASWANDESKVTGTWSYWVDGSEVVNQNSGLLSKLPDKGTVYRQTTTNYDNNNGAFDTSNWATSFMWDVDLDNPYSSSVYAIPLAFRASVDGGAKNVIQVTAPSSLSDTANNTYTMQMPSNGTVTDFFIQTPFDNVTSAKVDAVTDWSYDVVMENADNTSQYMKTTMVQGSIFAYFQLKNEDNLTILRGKSLPASIAYTSDAGNVIVVSCYDNMDEDYDYYAFYAAAGTTFTTTTSGNKISSIEVQFPDANNAYMTLAYLGSTPGSANDSWGAGMCQAYLPYAYNFVTDTKATYSYDASTSTVTTVYSYTLDNKAESTANGTIMGVLPHQYKHIKAGTNFLDYTYETVRGTMKTIAGSSFTTQLKYSGIIPYMPDYTEDTSADSTEEAAILDYMQDYLNYVTVTDEETGETSIQFFRNYEGTGDTYWDGKGLNRLANAMAAAEAAGDEELAAEMLTQLKDRLDEWFTYTDDGTDTTYFYYDDGVGSLFGFPQSYDSVNQINDHHFHYGYFIYAASQVAFRDPEWAAKYSGIIDELINDIACRERNSASSKYPYLRNFAPYEGHSWASGHANFDMGNNQESSSEALNAWAGIILWGEATGNTEIRDLGVYLYTTEISAVQNYWYDVDEDVLSDAYRYKLSVAEEKVTDTDGLKVENNSAAIVWGGSYTYATWFSANPLYIQGINLLPMNPTCFYLAGDADYIQQNWDLAYEKAEAAGWDMESWVDIWCQYYAMAFPDAALAQWKSVESTGDSYGVEGGDTKAHTYHFIQALCTYGTPDTSITSNTTLSTVFVKDGVKTYVAYNPTSIEKTVKFSDGYSFKVAAHSMGVEEEGSDSTQAKYTVQHYTQNADNSYSLEEEENLYGTIGQTATAEAKEYAGYTFDSDNSSNIKNATVQASGTVLKLYYERQTYSITYEMNGGTNAAGNPDSYQYKDSILLLEPTNQNGYTFTGWYKDAGLTTEITVISDTDMGDMTLYAGWQDPYELSLDATKKLTYDGDTQTITVTVSNVAESGSVTVLWKICDESAVDGLLSADAGAFSGTAATYVSDNTWTADFTSANGVAAGKYFVFRVNTVRDGVGLLTGAVAYEIPDGSSNKATYYVNHYKANLDGSYSLAESEKLKAEAGTNVSATQKTYTGFTYNSGKSQASGSVSAGGNTTLALYYDRNTYTISYELNGGTASGNPDSYTYGQTITLNDPTQTDKIFQGWYKDSGFTTSFSGISATTTGNLTLYAKWSSASSTQATYSVAHYKQKSAGSSTYSLYETETLYGYVDYTVYASAKSYDGYTENTTHASRVASGVVAEDGSLTLKLYYDVVSEGDTTEGYGVTYDADTGMAHFYYTGAAGGIVYIAVCDDAATAQGYVSAANAAWPGFEEVEGQAGYTLNATSSGAYFDMSVAEGKYVVYAFNPENKGVEAWHYAQAVETASADEATYTVKHYKQDTEGSTSYTLAETETFIGTIGATVSATTKSYAGYIANTSHANCVTSGVVTEDNGLVLSLYYDKSEEAGYDKPENGGYTYSDGVATFYYDGIQHGIVYVAVYDDLTKAESDVAKANSASDEGFGCITNQGGYMLVGNEDEENPQATVGYNVEEGKYLVYAFNPNYRGTEDWYVGLASETAAGSGGESETTATYTVEHHIQESSGSSYYVLKESETLTGTVGNTVIASANTYDGYKVNTSHEYYKASGVVSSADDLVLKLYYDVVSDDTGVDLEMPANGGYEYDSANSALTLYLSDATGGMLYYGVYSSQEAAATAVANANSVLPGFGEVDEGGYELTAGEGRAEYVFTGVTEGTCFVYTVTPYNQEPTRWYVGVATNQAIGDGGSETPEPEVEYANYTVEHYKQTALNSEIYSLAEKEVLSAGVGTNVTAEAKVYDGYEVYTEHELYDADGEVVSGDTLVLKIYYNVVEESDSNTPENGGYEYDADTSTLTMYYNEGTKVIVYYAVYDDLETAEDILNQANANYPGFDYVTGHTAPYLESNGERLELSISVDSGKYIVYAFNPDNTGVTPWYLGVASNETEETDPVTTAAYTIKYYKQNAEDLSTYTEVEEDRVQDTGTIGEQVTAGTNKDYGEYTLNNAKSNTQGNILADGSLVLSVYYDLNTYAITYNLNEGTNAGANAATYTYGVGLKLADPTKSGYTFAGWYTDADCTVGNEITEISATATGDQTVYAKWNEIQVLYGAYEIKYYLQNADDLSQYTVQEADTVTGSKVDGESVTATVKSYTGFVQNTTKGTASGNVANGSTLELSVYYDRATYNVTFRNMDEATNPNALTYTYGVAYTLQNPTKDGYLFDGWFSNSALTVAVTEVDTTNTAGITLYAKWSEEEAEEVYANYTIKHFKQNKARNDYEEVSTDTVVGSSVVGSLVSSIAKSYTGFTYNKDVEGTVTSGEILADGSLVLAFYYDRNVYNITYKNMDNATNAAGNVESYVYGVGLKLEEPSREAYTFGGWYTDSACTSEITEIGTDQIGTVTVYAKWTVIPGTTAEYTVKYYKQNTSRDGYVEVTEDGYTRTADVETVVSADTKTYTGFTQTKAGVTSGTVAIGGTLVLEVYFDRNVYGITYNNMQDGNNPATNVSEYVYGVGLTLANPTRDGYVFDGWYTDEEYAVGTKVTEISTTAAEAVVLYAKWSEVEAGSAIYTVKYFLQNTSRTDYEEATERQYQKTATIGSTATISATPVAGFTYNENKSTTSGEVLEDGSLVLTLYYDRNVYSITYNNMDGATNATANVSEYVYGVGLTLEEPTKEGYTFDGWYDNAEFTGNAITVISTSDTGNVELYAKWTSISGGDQGGSETPGTGDGGDQGGSETPGTGDGGDQSGSETPGTGDGDDQGGSQGSGDGNEDGDDEYVGPEYDFTVDVVSKEYYYTGKKIVPEIVVKDGNKVLVEKKDYTIKCKNNVKAGYGTIVIKGKGNYSGTVEKQFEIKAIDISSTNETVTVDDIYVAYKDGKSIKVSPKMKWGTKSLKLNKDYIIDGVTAYGELGEHEVTLKGIGNYTGERKILFVVTDKTLMSKVKVSKVAKQYYNKGEEITPSVTLTYKKQPLTEGTDYTIDYVNNTAAGTATIILTGIGEDYAGVKKVNFKILGTKLKTMPISLVSTEFQYTGEEIEPAYNAGSLEEGKDFTVTYSNNKKVGKGTVTFTGIGAYSGTVKKTFKITAYDIGANAQGLFEDVSGDIVVDYEKGGNKPAVSLKFAGNPVAEGIHYKVSYKDNKAAGTGTLTVKGKGILKGTYTKTFKIEKKDIEDVVLVAQDVVYKSGKKASYYMSKVTLTDVNGKKLSAGKDYDKNVTYTLVETGETFDKTSAKVANLALGTEIEVTVKGLGNYEGTTSLIYKVVPTSIKSAKVKISPQTYTGKAIILTEDDISVTVGGQKLTSEQFEIVEGSYVNNIKKGTAKVTICGISEEGYGGYKTVSFKIGAKGVKDFISNIFRFF